MKKKYYCPVCGYESDEPIDVCPLCGAKMAVREEGASTNGQQNTRLASLTVLMKKS